MTDFSVSLTPYPDSTPISLSIPVSDPTFCLLLQPDFPLSTYHHFSHFLTSKPPNLLSFTVIISEKCPWEATDWKPELEQKIGVYWKEKSEEFGVSEVDLKGVLVVLKGEKVVRLLTPPPENYLLHVPPPFHPLSLPQLSSKIDSGDTSDLLSMYSSIQTTSSTMNFPAISSLCSYIGHVYDLDLSNAAELFKFPVNSLDFSDKIDIKDVTFRDFLHRLGVFCGKKGRLVENSHRKGEELNTHTQIIRLKSHINAYEAQIQSLMTAISDRDHTISTLLQRWTETERLIADFRDREGKNDLHSQSTMEIRRQNSEVEERKSHESAGEHWKWTIVPPPKEPQRPRRAKDIVFTRKQLALSVGLSDSHHFNHSPDPSTLKKNLKHGSHLSLSKKIT